VVWGGYAEMSLHNAPKSGCYAEIWQPIHPFGCVMRKSGSLRSLFRGVRRN
jgi:hypothetical protein